MNKNLLNNMVFSRGSRSGVPLRKILLSAAIAGLGLVSASEMHAQCTIPTVTGSTSTPASCPGGGALDVNATGADLLFYSIVDGPTVVTEINNNGIFGTLNAGNYTVRVTNPENEGCFVETTVTVANEYTPFAFSLSATDICAGSSAGTIAVSATSGSSLPLQVAYWQGAANAPDGTLTYTTAMTHLVPESSFGIWNVRVKDACGEAITQLVNLANPYPDNLQLTDAGFNETPTACKAVDPDIDVWIRLQSGSTWVTASALPSEGVDIDIYEGASGSECNLSLATFIGTQTMNPTTGDKITVEREKRLIFVMRTPCGQMDTFCYNGIINQDKNTSVSVNQYGCPTVASPDGLLRLSSYPGTFMIPPIFHELLDVDGNVIDTATSTTKHYHFEDIASYGNTYSTRVTDACGDIRMSSVVTTPGVGDTLGIITMYTNRDNCTNGAGKVSARITFGGYFPGLSMSTTQPVITSGTDAGIAGVKSSDRSFWFYNLTPGAVNTVRVVNTSCPDDTSYISFTVPTYTVPLTQTISLTANSLCDPTGPGKGTLSFEGLYNGSGWPQIRIFKVGETTPIYTGPAGSGTLPGEFEVGSYYAEMELSWNPTYGCSSYVLTSPVVEIFPSGTLPEITKKISMICEDPLGEPTEGKVFIQLTGFNPYLIEYKLTTASESEWTTFTSTSNGTEIISGLEPGLKYNIRATDACGAIVTDFVTVNEMGPVTFENTVQPCEGTSYTIVAPLFANATYTWKKDGAALAETSNTLNFPLFSDANTGNYQCDMIIDNCLIRTMNITLYNELCDEPVTPVSISGNVFNDGNGLTDEMINGDGTNGGGLIYASITNAATGEVIGSVPVNADGTYEFNNVPAGDYVIVLTNGKPASGVVLTSGSLPAGWVNTGENIGLPTVTGNDGTIDGKSAVITVTTSNIININFGINRLPNSYDESQHIAAEPVPGVIFPLTNPLNGSDPEDTDADQVVWSDKSIVITTLPTNGFELLYDGVVVTEGQQIDNFDPSRLSVRATDATPESTDETAFTYATIDEAGFQDPTPATYTVTFEIPLPVQLIGFNVKNQDHLCSNILTWRTGSELNFAQFEILRSQDSRVYDLVGTVDAKGDNSKYEFVDGNVEQGTSYYLLRMVDKNGKSTRSKQEMAQLACNGTTNVVVYPTHTDGTLHISGLTSASKVYIVNTLGQKVTEVYETNTLNYKMNISNLASANYMVIVEMKNQQFVFKVTKN